MLILVGSAPAGAHATLVDSTPEAGAQLVSPPGIVVLRFGEPLIEQLSSATVVDPSGREHTASASARREIRIRVAATEPGIYRVEWTTVSPLDGHTLDGSFRYGVGVDPGPGAAGETAVKPGARDLVLAAARALEYAGLLFAIGALALMGLVRADARFAWVRPPVRAGLIVALVGGVVIVAGEMLSAGVGSLAGASAYLGTSQGIGRGARVVVAALAVAAWTTGHRWATVVLVVAAVALLSGAGHAAAADPAWPAVLADAAHLGAAGVWAGGAAALVTLRPPGGWRGDPAAMFLARFAPMALVAFTVTVAFGTVRAAQELTDPGDVVTTTYGNVLIAKLALVGAMVGLSFRAWRRRARTGRAEVVLVVGVVVLAGLLAAFPLPPRRLADADAALAPPVGDTALPEPDDLTFGSSIDETLVALTLRPARPGRNRILVYLQPLDTAVSAISAAVTVDGQRLDLDACGSSCRTTALTLRGGETVELALRGPGATGTTTFAIPPLPAPEADAALARVDARMAALRSHELDEVFGPGPPIVRSHWTIAAPARLHIEFANGAETIRIADTTYRRDLPDGPWTTSTSPRLQVPQYIWDVPIRTNARIVGRENVDGIDTQVVSFVGAVAPGLTPIWYRLWVDPSGLVHRAQMRTTGHFMDREYSGFDQAVAIEPPVQVGPGPRR